VSDFWQRHDYEYNIDDDYEYITIGWALMFMMMSIDCGWSEKEKAS
jgi:hypothetical protein